MTSARKLHDAAKRRGRAPRLSDYVVRPHAKLTQWSSDDTAFRGADKEAALARLTALGEQLEGLQNLFYADQRFKGLLVLQGMDTAGKDGTIKSVFRPLDPLGLRVAAFKAPTVEEQARDYLWRVHAQVPRTGEITIFNRSHYEDVLVPWVHGWIDDAERTRRFAQIRDFERMLCETGTVLIKCFLHISRDEQGRRLQARLSDPSKHWKFDANDLNERKLWDRYADAYDAALRATSTDHAPWLVVPADSKTNRDLMVATALIERFESLGLRYPPAPPGMSAMHVD